MELCGNLFDSRDNDSVATFITCTTRRQINSTNVKSKTHKAVQLLTLCKFNVQHHPTIQEFNADNQIDGFTASRTLCFSSHYFASQELILEVNHCKTYSALPITLNKSLLRRTHF